MTVTVESDTAALLTLKVSRGRMREEEAFALLKERLTSASVRHWTEDQEG